MADKEDQTVGEVLEAEAEELEAEDTQAAEVSEAEAPDEAAEAVEETEMADESAAQPEAEADTGPVRSLETWTNPNIPELRPGDAISVHVLIREGDRERIQEFRGTVIRLRRGGNNASFTVRRTASHGVGVERTFLLRSPLVKQVEIQRRAHVRRAKLYYLRDRTGKRARLKEKRDA